MNLCNLRGIYFLLLTIYRVDLCHQANEEDEEEEENDENSIQQALLEVLKREPGSPHVKDHRRCCSFQGIHVGSRQKYVITVIGKKKHIRLVPCYK